MSAPYTFDAGPVVDITDEQLLGTIVDTIRDAANNDPRSLQEELGPSELGIECDRRLLYKLLGVEQINWSDPLCSILGTAMHAWLGGTFTDANAGHRPPKWLVEQRVTVQRWENGDLSGSGDLFHVPSRTVLDWKVQGPTSYKELVRNGPGAQYETQLDAYGIGYLMRGLAPQYVGIISIPRASVRRMSQPMLRDIHLWRKPFDPASVVPALNRYERLRNVAELTADTLAPHPYILELADTADAHCNWCPWFKPNSTDLGAGCPGHDPQPVPTDVDPFPFEPNQKEHAA